MTSDTRIIGTFPDSETATAAEKAVAEAVGPARVHVGAPSDIRDAKVAEMQAEADHAGPMPATPPMTGHAAKASGSGALIGALIGALLILPLGFIPVASEIALGGRLGIAAIVGAVGGAVVGWLSGGYVGATVSTKPQAADRGVVVAVDADDERAVEAMLAQDPLRVDRVAEDGSLIEQLSTGDLDPEDFGRALGRAYKGHDVPEEIVEEADRPENV